MKHKYIQCKKINILVYLGMRKKDSERKIEVRAFSGYTLKNRYKNNNGSDLIIERLFIKPNQTKRDYRWFSVTPRDRNILFQIANQLGPRLGSTIRGVLAPLNAPFQKLVRVLFDRKLVWMGSPSAFWQATTYIVSMVYKQSYNILTRKGGLDPSQAKRIATSAARIFCNFMLTTRLTYQLANYAAGLEKPEELSEDELREIERVEAEEARSGETLGVNPAQLSITTKYIISAFRKLRLQQILEGLTGMEYRLIAYTFVVNSSDTENINWVRYARGSHAYTEIIQALTDIIIENVDEVLGATASSVAATGVAARKKKQHRSYSEDMGYESEHLDFDYEEQDYYGDEEYNEYQYDDDKEQDYYGDEEYDEYEYDDEEEQDYYDDEEYDEYEYDGEYEYEYEDYKSGDEYDHDEYEYDTEDEDGEFIEPAVEPEMTDYELTETGQNTMIEPVDDETERAEELVEAITALEPSIRSYKLAEEFLRTRTFSNSLSLKKKFYDFLVREFVDTRAFNKKEKEEMEEAAAELVDKLDVIAEDVKDMKTMLAKVIEAMDIATEGGDEGSDEESKESESSWDDFWRSDDSYEVEEESDEEETTEDGDEGESDEAESETDEEEGREGYRNYFARLRKYKKRNLRMPKKAAKPTKKPKAKGI
jgi:hypothetical protein